MNWSTETKTRVTFLVVGALVVVVGIFSYQNARSFIETNSLIAFTHNVLKLEDDTLIALGNLEAAQVDYLLTGDVVYRERYNSSRAEVLDRLTTLRTLLANSVTQMERLNNLMPLIAARLAASEGAIALRNMGQESAAAQLGANAVSRQLTENIRGIIDAMQAQSNQVLGTRMNRSDVSAQNTLAALIVLTILMVAVLGSSYYVINRDLSRRRQVEHLLQQERTLLRTVVDTLPDNIYVKDKGLRFVLSNKSQANLIGAASPDDLIGKTDADFFPPAWVTQYGADERAIFETGEPLINREEPSVQPNGELLTMLTTKVPVRNGRGEVTQIVGISHDITSRKRVEEEIEQLNANLRQRTDELESANRELEAFSYSISHDLRAPLRAIDGFSRILMQDYSSQLSEEAERYLQKVRTNAQRMGNLIDDLLHFSRVTRQVVNKQDMAPAALVQRILDEDLRSDRENREIAINIGELPTCKADPILMRQVYVNLLSNALKFTSKRERAVIDIGAKRENGGVVYYVKDNGAGFDEKYVNKLFGVFQRLHRPEDFEGTGVGLAIVQRVIHRHGGQVWAEGAVDQGATFYFTLGDVCE